MPVTGILALTLIAGCAHAEKPKAANTLTERQRDSAIGESKLPGAQGVKGALRASDSADARRAREDSIAQNP
jgi:hypothetical protein